MQEGESYLRTWEETRRDADAKNLELAHHNPRSIVHLPRSPGRTAIRACRESDGDPLDGVLYLVFPKRRDMLRALSRSQSSRTSKERRLEYEGWQPYSRGELRALLENDRISRAEALDVETRARCYSKPFRVGLRHIPRSPKRTLVRVEQRKLGRVIRFAELPTVQLAHEAAEEHRRMNGRVSWILWYPKFGEDFLALDEETSQ